MISTIQTHSISKLGNYNFSRVVFVNISCFLLSTDNCNIVTLYPIFQHNHISMTLFYILWRNNKYFDRTGWCLSFTSFLTRLPIVYTRMVNIYVVSYSCMVVVVGPLCELIPAIVQKDFVLRNYQIKGEERIISFD